MRNNEISKEDQENPQALTNTRIGLRNSGAMSTLDLEPMKKRLPVSLKAS
jgi:hypothetical protein